MTTGETSTVSWWADNMTRCSCCKAVCASSVSHAANVREVVSLADTVVKLGPVGIVLALDAVLCLTQIISGESFYDLIGHANWDTFSIKKFLKSRSLPDFLVTQNM